MTASRIYRGLVNEAWLLTYLQTEAIYLLPSLSDYFPVLLDIVHSVARKVWKKIKSIKTGLKSLNTKHFAKVSNRLEKARLSLAEVQSQLTDDITNSPLQAQETAGIEIVKYRMNTYESILKQKSRVTWIKLIDSNSHYYFYVLKQWQNRNRIDSIYTNNGVLLKEPNLVQAEILSFYQNLLGSAASSLPAVDIAIVRAGNQLSCDDIDILSTPVSHSEIDSALAGIGDDKAPGIDRFNVVITTRLAKVIGSVVNEAQAGLIPGKHIGDNILLAIELIKGYSHKFVNPRCMLKIDLRKAYESVEWRFLEVKLGLSANLDKSDAYFGGVLEHEKTDLQQVLGMANGSLPFKYIGVPLSS
ncbi:uncharacterized protein LOC110739017 [Chenopodium quinoa]|uniref:uncharacterized protein LOC110739017 n=1 Tax=Chenopodium quinoa TaxID=63459 RepID=UPI000B7821C9|nr:uncharacterized protein LOC110739017 [Chenopodium quinoa]